MIEALVFSNILLITLIGLPVLAFLSFLTEEKSPALTTLILVGILIFAWWVFSFNIFTFFMNNFAAVFYSLAGYLIIGVLYSFLKYYLFLLKEKENGRHKEYVSREAYDRVPVWIVYWPLSLIWTLLSDVLTRLVNKFVSLFKGVYDSILNYVFKDENEKKANDH